MKTGLITGKEKIADDIYSMWIKEASMAAESKPGQFISIYCKDGSRLLPRPISICEIDKEGGLLRIVFRIAGEGTKEIASFSVSEEIKVLGPLGNGFITDIMSNDTNSLNPKYGGIEVSQLMSNDTNSLNPKYGGIEVSQLMSNDKTAVLIGGGIGIPPMLELAKRLNCNKKIILGYRNSDTFLSKELGKYGDVYFSTEDGSLGVKGNVIDAVKQYNIKGDMVFACGPNPMLKGVKAWAEEMGIRAQLSLEERMACGIGACLACVCKTKEKDEHTNVHNARICKDGPVFYSEYVEL